MSSLCLVTNYPSQDNNIAKNVPFHHQKLHFPCAQDFHLLSKSILFSTNHHHLIHHPDKAMLHLHLLMKALLVPYQELCH